jgi:hypothetical protein
MWSLGVVAFILLSGRRPFHCRDRQEKIQRILNPVRAAGERHHRHTGPQGSRLILFDQVGEGQDTRETRHKRGGADDARRAPPGSRSRNAQTCAGVKGGHVRG